IRVDRFRQSDPELSPDDIKGSNDLPSDVVMLEPGLVSRSFTVFCGVAVDGSSAVSVPVRGRSAFVRGHGPDGTPFPLRPRTIPTRPPSFLARTSARTFSRTPSLHTAHDNAPHPDDRRNTRRQFRGSRATSAALPHERSRPRAHLAARHGQLTRRIALPSAVRLDRPEADRRSLDPRRERLGY